MIRKSTRHRTLTEKVKPQQPTNNAEASVKRRKIARIEEGRQEKHDQIDPVEKLLSLPRYDSDIISTEELSMEDVPYHGEAKGTELISLNFTKILNDNIRLYYSRSSRNQLQLCNDDSTFSLLNRQPAAEEARMSAPQAREVPFFKNVNFNSDRAYTFDDYFAYDLSSEDNETDEEKDPKTPSSPQGPTDLNMTSKMCFYYRDSDYLNLSSSYPKSEPQDIFKILNKNSILSGKASEMIGTGTFLINDFFL